MIIQLTTRGRCDEVPTSMNLSLIDANGFEYHANEYAQQGCGLRLSITHAITPNDGLTLRMCQKFSQREDWSDPAFFDLVVEKGVFTDLR